MFGWDYWVVWFLRWSCGDDLTVWYDDGSSAEVESGESFAVWVRLCRSRLGAQRPKVQVASMC